MKLLDRFTDWQTTAEFIGVICGLGVLGYICTTCVMALWSRGNYAVALTVSLAGMLLTVLALARIPIALVLLFGAASTAMVAFLLGHLGILLP